MTTTRNPRPYRQDDSFNNTVGTVGGLFAGLLGVALALGGTAALGGGGLMFIAGASNSYECNIGKKSPSACDEKMFNEMMLGGLIASGISLVAFAGAAKIFDSYKS